MVCEAPLALGSIAVGHDGQLTLGQRTWFHAHLRETTNVPLALRLQRLDRDQLVIDYAYRLPVESGHNCLRFELEVRVPAGHYQLSVQGERILSTGFVEVA